MSVTVLYSVAASVAFVLLFKIVGWYLHAQLNVIADLDCLGKDSRKDKLKGQVVVCGGSISGLLTARVCADHYEKVIVVEPEAWLAGEDGKALHSWEQKNTRSRVLQYNATHGVQGLNYSILSSLFPGFEDECRKSGISVGLADKFAFGGTLIKVPERYFKDNMPGKTIFTSRPGLETLIRRLVLSDTYPNIEQVCGTVTGIIPNSKDHSKLRGVTVRAIHSNETLSASLVIDCTGATKAGAKWLERGGYGYISPSSSSYPKGKVPLKDIKAEIDQKLFYTTQTYQLSDSLFERLPVPSGMTNSGNIYMYLEDNPTLGRRMFVVTKPDGKRIQLYAAESNDTHPSLKTLDDMITFVDRLPTFRDTLPDWLKQTMEMLREPEAEGAMTLSSGRVPPTSYLRYQMATNLPSNFIAIGDSVMTIDPVYGQGCTKAGLGAVALNTLLTIKSASEAEIPTDFSERFFKELSRKTGMLWEATRLLDYGIPCTTPIAGESLSSGAWLRAYLRRVQILAIHDEQAAMFLIKTVMGYATPLDPVHPKLVAKVAWDVLRRWDV